MEYCLVASSELTHRIYCIRIPGYFAAPSATRFSSILSGVTLAHIPSSIHAQQKHGANRLSLVSSNAQGDAALLLRHVLQRDRAWLLAHPEAELTDMQIRAYQALLERRLRYEPMQYILGEQEFYGLRFRVNPFVLIPRPETEHLVEAVLARMPTRRPVRIADVGTGSGAIAVSLAHSLPLAQIDALDLSHEALAVAQGNAQAHGVGARVRFLISDLLSAVSTERYDCIVSNPPYIADTEVLEPQVRLWEPRAALYAGPSGLELYRRLIPAAQRQLHAGGLLAVELGWGQAAAVEALLNPALWSTPEQAPDLQGIARVLLAHVRPAAPPPEPRDQDFGRPVPR